MAQRTLLQIVTAFTERRALGVPTTVFGSADKQVRQIRSLLEEGCIALAGRGQWEGLTKEASWATTAVEDQGAVTTLAPDGYRYMLPETLWDRTEKIPLVGRLTPQDWQALKAVVVTGPRYNFRLRGGRFLVNPAPPAAHTWVFEYISENWAETAAAVGINYFTADTNVIRLPDFIVNSDLNWRWKKEKGLTYAQDFEDHEALVIEALARDGGSKPTLYMHDSGNELRPGIVVPVGSWPL